MLFFFQAEDGIRDYDVTGVQTCALPIFRDRGLDASPKNPSALSHLMKSALALPSFAFGLSLAATAALPIIDDFNDGDSAGWTEHDPLQTASGGALGPFATFSFPGGNSYRIEAAASFNPGAAGPGRAFSLRQGEVLGDTVVAVDVLAWNDAVPQVFGPLARIAQPGLGTTDGYAFVYGPQSSSGAGGIDLFIIANETGSASSPQSA